LRTHVLLDRLFGLLAVERELVELDNGSLVVLEVGHLHPSLDGNRSPPYPACNDGSSSPIPGTSTSRRESFPTLRPDAGPLVGPALRVQHPVLGHTSPIQAKRCRLLDVLESPLPLAVGGRD